MVVRPSSLILKMKWSKVFTILGVIGNICIIQPGSGRVLPMWQGNTTNLEKIIKIKILIANS